MSTITRSTSGEKVLLILLKDLLGLTETSNAIKALQHDGYKDLASFLCIPPNHFERLTYHNSKTNTWDPLPNCEANLL
jgi:hypothetical protein